MMMRIRLAHTILAALLMARFCFAGQPVSVKGFSPSWVAPRPPSFEYPVVAQRKRITGSGLFVAHIDTAKGKVTSVDVLQSTGSKILDDAAVRGLMKWRVWPNRISKVRVPVSFGELP
jgi:TonB family protein